MNNIDKITESANTPEKSKERLKKMCENYWITLEKRNEINDHIDWLTELFELTEKDSWLIVKRFMVLEWEQNYINAVLSDIENEELEKEQYKADWNHSSK